MKKSIFLLIFVCAACTVCFAQIEKSTESLVVKPATQTVFPPGNIKLLPTYTHEKKQGYDTAVGEISRKDGMIIRYDIGFLANNSMGAPLNDPYVWYKRQEVDNQELLIGLMKSGRITAKFSSKNSYAFFFANTKSQEDVANFLLMILTYEPQDKSK